MKSFVFPYYVSFGKLDSVSCEIEIALSDKNAKRLERSAKEGGRFRLDEDQEISDIYDRVFDAILLLEKQTILSDSSLLDDALSWYDEYVPGEPVSEELLDRYLDDLTIGINYPESLQYQPKTKKRKARQSSCESVIIERAEAKAFISEPGNEDKVVYVDEGETLFYVPTKYSGTFIVSEHVRTIEGKAFKNRTKITEVVLPNGIIEIPECAFEACSSLEKINIPSTVKGIEYNTFTKCESLKSVFLSEGLLNIDGCAFRYCSALNELRIPASVKLIDPYIAEYYNGLTDLYFLGMETTIDGEPEDGFRSSVTMHVKKGSSAHKYAKKYRLKCKVDL